MARYRVELIYADGKRRTTTVNASSASSAKQGVRKLARRQLEDRSYGGDKSAGMPRIGTVTREE